ncbi:SLATT domain-containing protein [Thalassospira lucentensis]|uniref:SLATT domain-containing protein n=1 Tax=Thalassospira lucentensis TaxID=168935 RepID=UPI003D2B0E2D
MNEIKIKALKGRIWITAKTRMQAEKRYRLYDVVSHIYLCLLSFLAICLGVFSEYIHQDFPLSEVSIVVSVFIFGASIIVFGFSFGESAVLQRECYLRLQKAEGEDEVEYEKLHNIYCDINSSYPNHSTADYEFFIVERTFWHKKSIEYYSYDGKIVLIDWNWQILLSVIGRSAFFLAIMILPPVTFIAVFMIFRN